MLRVFLILILNVIFFLIPISILNASSKAEIINNIVVVQDQWTVENKLLTPTMKIKRKEIENLYIENYNNWYIKNKVLIV